MTPFPIEFQDMPDIRPPDMLAANNPQHDWLVREDWRTPAIDGKVVCVRGGIMGGDVLWHGFFTDGISVDRGLWTLIGWMPFSMPAFCGALGHDIIYACEFFPRDVCDQMLLQWWIMAGVDPKQARLFERFVGWFGSGVWGNHTPESIAESRKWCQLVNAGEEPVWAD